MLPERKPTRLRGYDYNSPGEYFITLCTKEKRCVLGQVPTNNYVSRFVGTFKRFCGRDLGENLWQDRSYDHVIRGEEDHREIWEYITNNPAKWAEDRFYQ